MYPTRIVNALHKHVPLIKFLGPRSKLHKGEIVEEVQKLHPAAQSGTKTSFSSAQKQSNNSKSIYMDYSQLPEKYKRKGPSLEEIDVIDLGGADHVIRYKGY
ncbi:16811_t:CDS:2 [Funneliformis mosseae]|uniref:16811_t:CDS:1 n=1 Tax=Funneliformis mosseae TaxID=27381 RepID=A0A9N8WKG9_FUNMO|nr:16811_t:CDS:2 [Funneliformis mosseae]